MGDAQMEEGVGILQVGEARDAPWGEEVCLEFVQGVVEGEEALMVELRMVHQD